MPRILGDDWVLPLLDDRNRAFFTSGTLALQACAGCGHVQHPPEDVCTACGGTAFTTRVSRGEGRIESVAVVHHPVHPRLEAAVPFAVVLVSLDDAAGVNVVGNVRNRPPADVAIGQRVRVVFEEALDPETGERLRIPQWEVRD
jgi:uncharacterized OB-fold protein